MQPTPLDRAFLTNIGTATELILVRHGQQVWPDPATSTVSEWVDPPLSDLGRRQAEAVGLALADRRDDAQRDITKARASLRRWVGERADDTLEGEPPATAVQAEKVRAGGREICRDITS